MCDKQTNHLHITDPDNPEGTVIIDTTTPADHGRFSHIVRNQIGLMKEQCFQQAGNPQAVLEHFPNHLLGVTRCLEIALDRIDRIQAADHLADASKQDPKGDEDIEIK